ncbi:MAG: PAS domain S-box protein [Fimbriimonadaceae bacterium]|nr:PAS domain S-box protein [Fimbriimonadaceae bacterium]
MRAALAAAGFEVDFTAAAPSPEGLPAVDLLDQIRDLVCVTDLSGRITYVNGAQCALLGLARADLVGRTTAEAFALDEASAAQQLAVVQATLEHGTWRGEAPGRTLAGRDLVIDLRTELVRNAAGEPVGLIGVGTDITALRRDAEALQQSEEKFATAFRACPAAMAIARAADGRLLEVNDLFLRLSGYDRAEILGRTSLEAGLWQDPALRETYLLDLQRDGHAAAEDVPFRMRDGSVRRFEMASEAITLAGEPCHLHFLVDVTQQLADQQALRASEEFHREVGANIPGAVWQAVVQPDGQVPVTYLSAGAAQVFERPVAELLAAQRIHEHLHPGDLEAALQTVRQAAASLQPYTHVARLSLPDGREKWLRSSGTPRRQADGSTLLTGVTLDITDRVLAEQRQTTLVQHLREVITAANELLGLPDEEQICRRAIELLRDRLGLRRCGLFLLDVDPPRLRPTFGINARGETVAMPATPAPSATCWADFLTPDPAGGPRWQRETDVPLADHDGLCGRGERAMTLLQSGGRALGILFNDNLLSGQPLADITQEAVALFASLLANVLLRHRLAAELAASESRYRLIAELAYDVIWVFDLESGRLTYVSPSVERQRGFTPAEVIAQGLDEAMAPASAELVKRQMGLRAADFAAGGEGVYTDLLEHTCRDGSTIWTEVTTRHVRHPETGRIEIHGVSRDVSARRAAEAALQRQHELWTAILRSAIDGFWIADTEGRLLEVNDAYCALTGYSRDELLTMRIADVEAIEDQARILERIAQIRASGTARFESLHRRKDGSVFDVEVSVRALEIDGGRIIDFLRDITAQKQAERQLRAAHQRLAALFERGRDAILVADVATGLLLDANEAASELTGRSREELVGLHHTALYEPDLAAERQLSFVQRARGRPGLTNAEVRRPDGTRVPVEISGSLVDLGDGRQVIQGFFRDVSARLAAEAAVREAHERFAALFGSARDAILVADAATGVVVDANQAAETLLARSRQELVGLPQTELHPPEHREQYRAAFRHHLTNLQQLVEVEVWRPDGSTVPVEINSSVVTLADGRTLVQGNFRDITARRAAEAARREAEARYRTLFEDARDAIIVADPATGVILEVNQAACELSGRSAAELVGQSVMILHPEATHERMRREFGSHAAGVHSLIESAVAHRDGHAVPVEISANLATLGDGRTVLQGLFRDITARLAAEAALRESQARLQQLADGLPDGMVYQVVSSPSGAGRQFTYVSGGVDRLHQVTAEAVLANPSLLYEQIHPDDRAAVVAAEASAIAAVRPFRVEVRVVLPNGHERWRLFSSAPRPQPDGSIIWDGLELDITDRRFADAALEESRRRIESLGDRLPDGMIYQLVTSADLSRRYFPYISAGVQKLHQVTPAQVYADPWLLYSHALPEYLPKVIAEEQRAVSSRTPFRAELQVRLPDGQLRWRLITSSPRPQDDGSILWDGLELDITERREAEQRLAASEQQHRTLIEALPDLVLRFDTAGRYVYASPNALASVPVSAVQILGRTPREAGLPEPICAFWEAHLPAVVQGGRPLELPFSVDLAGTRWALDWRLIPEPDASGVVQSVLAIGHDVTQQRQLEEDYRLLFSTMQEGFALHEVITNDAGEPVDYRYLAVNPAFERQTGLCAADMLGRTVLELLPDTEPEWIAQFGAVALTGQPTSLRRYSQALGKHYEVSGYSPAPRQFAVTVSDVTEQVDLAARLEQAQRLESLGRLAGGVAHDLNNLLTPVLGYTEMLLNDLAPGDPRHDDLSEVHGGAQRARDLTRQLLAFGRRQTLQVAAVDLGEVIRGFSNLLRRSLHDRVALRLDLPATPVTVQADGGQLEQVLLNLAVNAQDAMPDGGELQIALATSVTDGGGWAEITVADSGVGMTAEVQRQIFEPFFTTKAQGEGTGLGLATVVGIIEQHGGSVSVDSTPGSGSRFLLRLPWDPTPAAAILAPGAAAAAPEEPPLATGGPLVLVVDDDDAVRGLALRMLERRGYRSVAADSAEAALELVATLNEPLALLLSDLLMPGLTGRELYARLLERQPGLPVVFMSGYDQQQGRADGLPVLLKPFSIAALGELVAAQIGPGLAASG